MSELGMTIKSRLGDYQVRFHEDYGFLKDILAKPNTILVIDRKVFDIYKGRRGFLKR